MSLLAPLGEFVFYLRVSSALHVFSSAICWGSAWILIHIAKARQYQKIGHGLIPWTSTLTHLEQCFLTFYLPLPHSAITASLTPNQKCASVNSYFISSWIIINVIKMTIIATIHKKSILWMSNILELPLKWKQPGKYTVLSIIHSNDFYFYKLCFTVIIINYYKLFWLQINLQINYV